MFLSLPPDGPAVSRIYASDEETDGYVNNLTRLWAWRPEIYESFMELRALLTKSAGLSKRELAILVCSAAATLGDSYCSHSWGKRLAKLAGGATAAAVLSNSQPDGLSERESVLAAWARKVVKDPNATTPDDVQALRAAGLSDREIFEATAFVALRVAFSTVNDALGAPPDRQLVETSPSEVRAAITFGRSPSTS